MSARKRIAELTLVLALAPLGAFAHSITDEVSAGTTQQGPRNPRTGFLADRLRGTAELSDALSLQLSLGLTHDNPTPPEQGARFGDTGGNIFSSALGLDWSATEHVSLGMEVDFSPANVQRSATTVSYATAKGPSAQADALLRAASSSFGAVLTAGFDTAGDSDAETAADVTVSFTHLDSEQSLARIEQSGQVVTVQAVRDGCATATTAQQMATCRALKPALRGEAAALTEVALQASLTGTLWLNTDVTLSGAYFLYDQDPTQVGYFSTLTVGRASHGLSFGGGIPVAPVLFSARPQLMHRFGPIWVDGWYAYTRYVDDEGYGHAVGIKLQYVFSKSVRVWASGSGQLDLQPAGTGATAASTLSTTLSGSLALGMKFAW